MTAVRQIMMPLKDTALLSPTALAAFHWLESQKMKIVFDEGLLNTNVTALYHRRDAQRWISLSPNFKDKPPEKCIATLVHETRHAWQDAQGLFLRNNLRFNMRYGMMQAFFWLCAVEADAYAQGAVAAHEIQGVAPAIDDVQQLYMDWFDSRLPHYLDAFVAKWSAILSAITEETDGDPQAFRLLLSRHGETGHRPLNAAALQALGHTFTGFNYQQVDGFHLTAKALLSHALENTTPHGRVALAKLDAQLAALYTPASALIPASVCVAHAARRSL